MHPPLLTTSMKWVMIDRSISVATQLILQVTKTKRQVRYIPTSDSAEMRSVIAAPLNVGLGMVVHQKTRSKELVETLADLNLSINYHKVINIKANLANSVREQMTKSENVFIPPCITSDSPVFLAIDNSDPKIDTADGKG